MTATNICYNFVGFRCSPPPPPPPQGIFSLFLAVGALLKSNSADLHSKFHHGIFQIPLWNILLPQEMSALVTLESMLVKAVFAADLMSHVEVKSLESVSVSYQISFPKVPKLLVETTMKKQVRNFNMPQLTGCLPQLTDCLPQLTDCLPQLTGCLPQLTDCLPQLTDCLTDCLPKLTDCLPQLTGCLPQLTGCLPQLTGCLPQLTGCLPKLTVCLPQLTDCLPHLTDCLPQLTDCLTTMLY